MGSYSILFAVLHGNIQRRGGGGQGVPPPGKTQKIGFLSNTGQDPLKNQNPTKPAFNFGPLSACQHAI